MAKMVGTNKAYSMARRGVTRMAIHISTTPLRIMESGHQCCVPCRVWCHIRVIGWSLMTLDGVCVSGTPRNKWTWKWHGRITLTWRSRTERNNVIIEIYSNLFDGEVSRCSMKCCCNCPIFFLWLKRDKGGEIFAFERSWCPLQSAWSILIAENVLKEPSKASSHSETLIQEVNIVVISRSCRISQDHHVFVETALRDVGMHTPTTMMRMLIEWHQKIMGKDCLTETTSSESPVDVDRGRNPAISYWDTISLNLWLYKYWAIYLYLNQLYHIFTVLWWSIVLTYPLPYICRQLSFWNICRNIFTTAAFVAETVPN